MLFIERTFVPRGVAPLLFTMFHTSSSLRQLPNHPLYPKIDWSKVGGGYYAIVDPMDNLGILYLTEKEYKIQIRVSVSQDSQLSVLARPGETSQGDPGDPSSSSGPASSTKLPPIKEQLGLVRRDSLTEFLSWHRSRLEKFRSDTARRADKVRKPFSPSEKKTHTRQTDESGGSVGQSLVTPTSENLLSLVLHWGLDLNVRAGGQLEPQPAFSKALSEFGQDLVQILVSRGRTALVLKMKNTLFFLNRWLAGFMNDNPFLLGEPVGLARSGLPRIIPLYFRRAIGSNNLRCIRVMQSLLKAYSAFEAPHKDCDLVSVTGTCPPLSQDTLEDFQKFCKKVFWPKVVRKYARKSNMEWVLQPKLSADTTDRPFYPVRGGPNHRVGILGAPLDALAWAACPTNYPRMWACHVGDTRTVQLFDQTLEAANHLFTEENLPRKHIGERVKRWSAKRELDTGKLAFLPEAAGKVRTIAIVDYWTQRLMKPVHDWMMSVLSVLPTDGTFDQEGSLRSYVDETKLVSRHYSIDLKSATDMIPIDLYSAVLKGIWPEETVELWMALLTDRWFRVPSSQGDYDPLVQGNLRGTVVQYLRGQPMGTLSSWASMALVHHALELFAAQEGGVDPTTFTGYRVLGDDNVTGNCLVAASYKTVCEKLQVPISHSKTLEGKLFVFASQVYLKGENISPMSLKQELSVRTCAQRVDMALRAVSRGWIGDKPTSARFLRLLLRKRDYLRSVQEMKLGRLGRVAQAALVSAFGLSGRILSSLGFQGSGSVPFLLSLENKVQALAGDKCHLDLQTLSLLKDVESLFAITLVHRTVAMIRKDLLDLQDAKVRWTEWRDGMSEYGHLPYGWKKGPVQWILLFPPKDIWNDPGPKMGKLPIDVPSWHSYSQAIWPVLSDYYDQFFGRPSDHPWSSAYDDIIAEDEGIGWEDQGTGVTFSDTPLEEVVSTGGQPARIPDIVKETSSILSKALDLLHSLVRGDEDGRPLGDALGLVSDVIETKSHLPRMPSLLNLESLTPDRSPKAVDEMRNWVRQMKTYSKVLSYLPLSRDFSVLDAPIDDGLSEDEEALRTTSRQLLLSIRQKRSTSSRATVVELTAGGGPRQTR